MKLPFQPSSPIPEVMPAEALAAQQDGALLIDVRQPEETDLGKPAGCTCIPLPELPDRLDEIPHDKPIYLVCRSGGRSSRAAKFLSENGYQSVYNVRGGFTQWSAERLPSD